MVSVSLGSAVAVGQKRLVATPFYLLRMVIQP